MHDLIKNIERLTIYYIFYILYVILQLNIIIKNNLRKLWPSFSTLV